MRVLIVGSYQGPWYQEYFGRALRENSCEVIDFPWMSRFCVGDVIKNHHHSRSAWFQNRFIVGPLINKLQSDLLEKISETSPEIILFFAGTHIKARTIKEIKKKYPDKILVSYNNDDPFSPHVDYWLWRHFHRAVGLFDLHFVYRHVNLEDLKKKGIDKAFLLRSYYCPWDDYPVELSAVDREKFESDVVFVGHYERDGRLEALRHLKERGVDIHLHGGGWNKVRREFQRPPMSKLWPVQNVLNEDYRKAICGAKICLNFLSKLNRDTYTRRCFQIPAMKSLLMSEYTQDLASLFKEDEEIVFFRSNDELLEKCRYYLDNPDACKKIALAGYERVFSDGGDIISRGREFLEICSAPHDGQNP